MAIITMPQLGESVTEGTVLHWMKKPGDPVALDDPLCEIETEKVTAELPSPFAGTMGEIFAAEGETVAVGARLCAVEETAEAAAAPTAIPAGAAPWSGGPMAIPPDGATLESARTPVQAPAAPRRAEPATRHMDPESRERFFSPVVMRLAQEHAIDPATLKGTGIGGRVTRRDVEAAVAARGAPATVTPAPEVAVPGEEAAVAAYTAAALSATRKKIAENLVRSNIEAPQAWTMIEADVTGLVRAREREKERFARDEGIDLTLLPFFAYAVCQALRDSPALNARWEGGELRRHHALNLGIAVAAESGLVVPVVHDAGSLSVEGLAHRIADLAGRARARRLRVEDIEGGTFTVNNTGAFGSVASKPLVNHPQVAIVTMERVVKRPVVVEGDAIAVRSMVNVCLSFDHRALDGHEAGAFLAALKTKLEAVRS